MQKLWLKKENNSDLIIYMLGWAATPNAVLPIDSGDRDVLCCYDYRTLEPLTSEELGSYRHIYLFAWSFGVWVTEQCCQQVPLYKAYAMNGTPYPVDDRYGMRLRVVMRTMQGLARVGMNPFNDKAYGGVRHMPEGPYEELSIEDKIQELTDLAERSRANSSENIDWTQAYIGDKDEIFPPAKMWAYWEGRSLGIGFDSYHYPYADPYIVLQHLEA